MATVACVGANPLSALRFSQSVADPIRARFDSMSLLQRSKTSVASSVLTAGRVLAHCSASSSVRRGQPARSKYVRYPRSQYSRAFAM
jgi:hypothetical protein